MGGFGKNGFNSPSCWFVQQECINHCASIGFEEGLPQGSAIRYADVDLLHKSGRKRIECITACRVRAGKEDLVKTYSSKKHLNRPRKNFYCHTDLSEEFLFDVRAEGLLTVQTPFGMPNFRVFRNLYTRQESSNTLMDGLLFLIVGPTVRSVCRSKTNQPFYPQRYSVARL